MLFVFFFRVFWGVTAKFFKFFLYKCFHFVYISNSPEHILSFFHKLFLLKSTNLRLFNGLLFWQNLICKCQQLIKVFFANLGPKRPHIFNQALNMNESQNVSFISFLHLLVDQAHLRKVFPSEVEVTSHVSQRIDT